MYLLVLAMLVVAALGFVARVVRGPSLADRVIAVDGLVIVATAAVVVDALRRDTGYFLDAAILLALIAFVGTGVTARFVEQRGA